MGRIVFAATLLGYALVPVAALLLLRSTDRELSLILRDAGIATIPMIALALITWRLVWPRWKLVAKVVVHPFLYAILSIFLGAWSILIAWIHQGVLGLGVISGSAGGTASLGMPSRIRTDTSPCPRPWSVGSTGPRPPPASET